MNNPSLSPATATDITQQPAQQDVGKTDETTNRRSHETTGMSAEVSSRFSQLEQSDATLDWQVLVSL